jgi:choline dehydrogenase
MYRTANEENLGGRSLIYPRGKVLGGCSSINGMIYMRGQAQDYDHWAQMTGDASWNWQSVLPLFKRFEDHHGGGDDFHGSGGEWRVEKQRLSWEILEAFQRAAAENGIATIEDFNRGDNAGCAYFEVNQKRGIRWNAAKAFLKDATQRPNVTLMTGCQVKNLVFEKSEGQLRCAGVEFVGNGKLWRAESRAETILAAGAVGSPQILQLSGIGPGALLQRHGIAVQVDLLGVGQNLQDHLQLRTVYQFEGAKSLNMMMQKWWGKAQIGLQYAISRSGPMAMAPSQLGAFAYSSAEVGRPDLEYHVQPLSLEKFGDPMHDFSAFTASVCYLRPTSRGEISIQSADFLQAPLIQPNYLSTVEDREIAVKALQLTRKIVASKAFAAYAPQELKPGLACKTPEELLAAAGQIGTTIFHPVGTCKMGADKDELAVVDSQLRVRGVVGLRVVDASVMPLITSGNTNSPTMMIAEKAAQMILQK